MGQRLFESTFFRSANKIIAPKKADETEKIVLSLYATPPDVVAYAKHIMVDGRVPKSRGRSMANHAGAAGHSGCPPGFARAAEILK